jgi:hypothetical protein
MRKELWFIGMPSQLTLLSIPRTVANTAAIGPFPAGTGTTEEMRP